MTQLNTRALKGLFRSILTLAALIFLPTWTIDYWQAWVFLGVLTTATLMITVYLMRHDPKLLERRMTAGPIGEKETSQQIIMSCATVAFIAVILIPSLDHRFMWSTVPVSLVLFGNALVISGLYYIFLVFKENTFTSGTIAIHKEQKVISTGPYAWIRHPMYSGGIVFIFGIPLALGSYWGLSAAVVLTIIIVWRLLEEERFLAKNLVGYGKFQATVPYRLIPYIW